MIPNPKKAGKAEESDSKAENGDVVMKTEVSK